MNDGWACEPGQERYLEHLRQTGALAEADRVMDAVDAGEDLGPGVSVDELLTRWGQP